MQQRYLVLWVAIALSLGFLIGMWLAVVPAAAAVTCAKQPTMLAQHARFKHMEGGIPKGEVEEFLPPGSIVTVIVDRETREWKIMTTRPDSVTCIVFEGMEWMEPDEGP